MVRRVEVVLEVMQHLLQFPEVKVLLVETAVVLAGEVILVEGAEVLVVLVVTHQEAQEALEAAVYRTL